MKFVNRVILQGYLEIASVEQVVLDASSNLASPILHGHVWTDPSGLEKHRLVIADKPAIGVLEMLRRFNPDGGSAILSINDTHLEIAHLDGKPFVSVEGRLIDGVVDVKHISLLSTPEASILRLVSDHRLREIVLGWGDIREDDRSRMYRIVSDVRASRRTDGQASPLSPSALGRSAPDGAKGGLSSSPPAPRREAPGD